MGFALQANSIKKLFALAKREKRSNDELASEQIGLGGRDEAVVDMAQKTIGNSWFASE